MNPKALVVFEGKKKTQVVVLACYVIATLIKKKNEEYFRAQCYGITKNFNEVFAPPVLEIKPTQMPAPVLHRLQMTGITQIIRRIAELKIAAYMSAKISEAVLLLDGNLGFDTDLEKNTFAQMREAAQKNNVTVAALSKTCTILSEHGQKITAILARQAPYKTWYGHLSSREGYTDISEDSRLIYFAKLHEKSRHIFKIEFEHGISQSHERAERALHILRQNSTDAVLVGYPYGLIEADRLARVSEHESAVQKNMIMAMLGNYDAQSSLNDNSVHDALDRMQF